MDVRSVRGNIKVSISGWSDRFKWSGNDGVDGMSAEINSKDDYDEYVRTAETNRQEKDPSNRTYVAGVLVTSVRTYDHTRDRNVLSTNPEPYHDECIDPMDVLRYTSFVYDPQSGVADNAIDALSRDMKNIEPNADLIEWATGLDDPAGPIERAGRMGGLGDVSEKSSRSPSPSTGEVTDDSYRGPLRVEDGVCRDYDVPCAFCNPVVMVQERGVIWAEKTLVNPESDEPVAVTCENCIDGAPVADSS